MKHLLLSFVCLLLSVSGKGSSSLEWSEGSIVLSDDQVRPGEIVVQATVDIILFRSGGDVTVYPAHKISSVHVYDAAENINRRFVSVPVLQGHVTTFRLYEVVLHGKMSVVRRQKDLTLRKTNDPRDFAYFIYSEKQLRPLRRFIKEIYPFLTEADQMTIASHMKSAGLNPFQASDIIRIIDFYNRLCAERLHLARG